MSRAMVLAAGLGTRMRPLTDTVPKPLLAVAGQPMLDHVLDRLAAAGVGRVVVNTFHLGAQIAAHLAGRARPEITLVVETALLETGGGVLNALPQLGSDPFVVANADLYWREAGTPLVSRLWAAWDAQSMDALLALLPVGQARGYDGRGDFFRDPAGRLHRRAAQARAPYVFIGVQILSPTLFDGLAPGAFSLNRIYDRALAAGRLYGLEHWGDWFHIGTPAALAAAREVLG